jgi:hypothetical protein
MMTASIWQRGVVGAILMLAAHVLVWMFSLWFMLSIPPRYEQRLRDWNVRLPAATEATFALAHRITSRPDLLPVPLLLLLVLDAAALIVLRWRGERGWSWVWFFVVLALVFLPMSLTAWGSYLAELKLRETAAHIGVQSPR